MISGADSRLDPISTTTLSTLNTLVDDYDQYMQELSKAHEDCQSATKGASCTYPARPSNWPDNPIPSLPHAPTGVFSIVIDKESTGPTGAPTVLPSEIWDKNRTRASLSGLNPLASGKLHALDPSTSSNQIARPEVKFQRILGKLSNLYLLVNGASLQDVMQIAYKEDGSSDYTDIGQATRSTCGTYRDINRLQLMPSNVSSCIFVEGRPYKFSDGGLEDSMASTVFVYILLKTNPTLECTDDSTHTGIFSLHIFDNFGRDYYIPVFCSHWKLHHYHEKPPGLGCHRADDTADLSIIQ